MNHSDNANVDLTHNDEGYVEQRFEAPDFMVKWTEEQKAGKTIVENRELEGPNYLYVCARKHVLCELLIYYHLFCFLLQIEFAYQLLLSIPTSRSLKVVDRLGPILHRDFFSVSQRNDKLQR